MTKYDCGWYKNPYVELNKNTNFDQGIYDDFYSIVYLQYNNPMDWPFCIGNSYDCMVYKTNTTYLSETNASYIPFTHMYIKNLTDLTASIPPLFDNWLNNKSDGFIIRSIEEYF